MMQMQLNVQLTDEQYKDLMESSFQTVFNDDATTIALRNMIVDKMSKYIDDHPKLLDDYFRPMANTGNSWDQRQLSPTLKVLIEEAAKPAQEEIRKAIYSMMVKTVKDPKSDVSNIVLSLLTRAIMDGILNGSKEWMRISVESQRRFYERLVDYNVLHDVPDELPDPSIFGLPDNFDGTKES